jgi:hypothetical protein
LNQNSQALNSSAEPQPINYLRATTAKPHRFLAPLHAIVGALAMRKKSRVKEVVLCHEELLTPPLITHLRENLKLSGIRGYFSFSQIFILGARRLHSSQFHYFRSLYTKRREW